MYHLIIFVNIAVISSIIYLCKMWDLKCASRLKIQFKDSDFIRYFYNTIQIIITLPKNECIRIINDRSQRLFFNLPVAMFTYKVVLMYFFIFLLVSRLNFNYL